MGGTVLFVCVENSFRSQIAEAYFNALAPPGWKAVSAGVDPADRIHPLAVKLMLEEGIDISRKRPRKLTRKLIEEADLVVVVCEGRCPVTGGKLVETWRIPDPARMPPEKARQIRDCIKRRVEELIERLRRGETEL